MLRPFLLSLYTSHLKSDVKIWLMTSTEILIFVVIGYVGNKRSTQDWWIIFLEQRNPLLLNVEKTRKVMDI